MKISVFILGVFFFFVILALGFALGISFYEQQLFVHNITCVKDFVSDSNMFGIEFNFSEK
jgi:hypothetical protein